MRVNKGKSGIRITQMLPIFIIFYLSLFLVPYLEPPHSKPTPPTTTDIVTIAKAEALPQITAEPKDPVKEISEPVKQAEPVGTCKDWIIQAGIDDVYSAYTLIMRESTCKPYSINSIGCIGLGQNCPDANGNYWLKDACPNWQDDPVCQMKRFNEYAVGRYGSWANALAHSYAYNWY